MKFSKLKLVNGGLHGVTANYIEFEEKNNLHFENVITRERKAPAHKDLKEAVRALQEHLAGICCIGTDYWDEVEVTGVSSDADGQFIIMGKVRAAVGELTFALNTPLIKRESGYGEFDAVIEKIKKVYEHASDYFEKKIQPDNRQIALDFVEFHPNGITKEDVEKMADGDLLPLMVKAIERKGAMVLLPEEMQKDEQF